MIKMSIRYSKYVLILTSLLVLSVAVVVIILPVWKMKPKRLSNTTLTKSVRNLIFLNTLLTKQLWPQSKLQYECAGSNIKFYELQFTVIYW